MGHTSRDLFLADFTESGQKEEFAGGSMYHVHVPFLQHCSFISRTVHETHHEMNYSKYERLHGIRLEFILQDHAHSPPYLEWAGERSGQYTLPTCVVPSPLSDIQKKLTGTSNQITAQETGNRLAVILSGQETGSPSSRSGNEWCRTQKHEFPATSRVSLSTARTPPSPTHSPRPIGSF